MASNLPRSIDELLQIKGIGQEKAARYGVTFLNIIREFA
jgi:superfamily II DNA helicase RecQ